MSERRGGRVGGSSGSDSDSWRRNYVSGSGSSSYPRQRNRHSGYSRSGGSSDADSWVGKNEAGVLGLGGSENWNIKRSVKLTSSLKDYYEESRGIERGTYSWLTEANADILSRINYAKRDGAFAKTSFEYSVLLLGSMCLSNPKPSMERLIEELYNNGFNKVQHGVFAMKPREFVVGGVISENDYDVVANELADLFNKEPELRRHVRRQWMESKADGKPHEDGKYLATRLRRECNFLISEYIKHAPDLGLTVKQYVEFTSTLFDHCDPVSSFGERDQNQRYAFIKPENSLSEPTLQNLLTKSSLCAKLLSPPHPTDPIPNKVICRCNASHVCILTEIRYLFEWENNNLVNNIPSVVNTRIDFCDKSTDPHYFSYLTQKDRSDLVNFIKLNPSYGFYEKMSKYVAQAKPPNQPDDDGFTTVVRKGKAKGKGFSW